MIPYELTDFRKGQRVQLHPGCDQWMQGDRYGEVKTVGRWRLTLRMDSGRLLRAKPTHILEIVS